MNWTQPICEDCWKKMYGQRQSIKIREADQEQCCMCGHNTNDGIYIRANPDLVNFPRK